MPEHRTSTNDPVREAQVPPSSKHTKELVLYTAIALVILAVPAVILFMTKDEAQTFASTQPYWSFLISTWTLAVGIVGLLVIFYQLQRHVRDRKADTQSQLDQLRGTHEWNRRKAAHDLIFEASLGSFRALRDRLEQKIDVYNPDQTYASVKDTLDKEDHVYLDATLNFFENVCLAIKNNVINEDIIFQSLSAVMIAYMRWAEPYITHNRETIHFGLWQEIDPFVDDWLEQHEQQKAEHAAGAKELKERLVPPALGPTG